MNIKLSYDSEFEELMSRLKKHYGERIFEIDGIGEKQLDITQFSKNFFSNKVASDISVDANSNVESMSVIVYEKEFKKSLERLNSYYMLWKGLKKRYGGKVAACIIEEQLSGDIYIHDFHGFSAGFPYCFNYSTYDILAKGLPMVEKIKCLPPKYLTAFKSQLEQFVVLASNSTVGATGFADLLLVMSYYVKNILKTKSDAHYNFATEEDCWKYVKEMLVSFIYTINQPMRSSQAPFTNISVYDTEFLMSLQENYIFPDGSMFDIDVVKKLQDVFLTVMNEELSRSSFTFPVTTACFSIDKNKEIKDEEFLSFIARHNKKYGFINCYTGESSTLSSCCFDGNTLVSVCENGKRIDVLFKDLFSDVFNDGKYIDSDGNLYTYLGPDKMKCKMIRVPYTGKTMYNIKWKDFELDKEYSVNVTEDHLFPVWHKNTVDIYKGMTEIRNKDFIEKRIKLVQAKDLTTSDKIMVSNEMDAWRIQEINTWITPDNKPYYVYCFEILEKNEPYFSLPDSDLISHNCRLRSSIKNEYFNSFGSGKVKVGSIGVVTINLPRIACIANDKEHFLHRLRDLVISGIRVNQVKRELIQKRIDNGNHPLYSHGFLDLSKQYSTTGINGINEAVELMGMNILTEEGQEFTLDIINTINEINDKMQARLKIPLNTEQVPAESVSIKLADKDRLLEYQDTYQMYSNQFIPLTVNADMLDRLMLQGKFDSHFSGGAICHINVETQIDDEEKIKQLIRTAAKMGVIYFAVNYNIQKCVNEHISVGKKDICVICNESITDNYTRVVGFIVNTKNFPKKRRELDYPERKFYKL